MTLWKKLYLIYSFFFLRKIVVHFFTFFFYCVILPTSVFFPEVNIPAWSTFYIPSLITLFIVIATPRLISTILLDSFCSIYNLIVLTIILYCILDHSISWYFGSCLKTWCPCIVQREHSSAYLKEEEWMNGLLLRS